MAWSTVAAFVTGALPPRQDLWLCRTPDCPVIYLGDAGDLLTLDRTRVRPGFKAGGDLLCYCFLVGRGDLARAAEAGDPEAVIRRVTAAVRVGHCACEVRNPTGRCCLGQLRREVEAGKASK